MTSRKYDVIYKTVMADCAFTLTRDKQVTYIKIDARMGKSAVEIQKALEEVDRRYSCDEIAHELDISHGSVHRILTETLQMRKIAARWVPHIGILSENEKHERVNSARKLLKRYGEDGYKESLRSMRHGFGLLNPN